MGMALVVAAEYKEKGGGKIRKEQHSLRRNMETGRGREKFNKLKL